MKHRLSRNFRSNVPACRAFSLVELLAVMAVVSIMMAATVPAISGLKRTGDIRAAADDIAGTLEQARAYAMANNTYVFVGFAERDPLDITKAGNGQMVLATVGSKNGSRTFGTDNDNLAVLSKLLKMPNVRLADNLPNSGGLVRPDTQGAHRVANDGFVAQDTFSVSGLTFSKIIQFDPRGMVSVQSRTVAIPQWLEIGLAGATGSSSDCAAVVIDGVTGAAKIYRP